MNGLGIPADVVPVWAVPDGEPVDTACLTPAVRADWITDALVKDLED